MKENKTNKRQYILFCGRAHGLLNILHLWRERSDHQPDKHFRSSVSLTSSSTSPSAPPAPPPSSPSETPAQSPPGRERKREKHGDRLEVRSKRRIRVTNGYSYFTDYNF